MHTDKQFQIVSDEHRHISPVTCELLFFFFVFKINVLTGCFKVENMSMHSCKDTPYDCNMNTHHM